MTMEQWWRTCPY